VLANGTRLNISDPLLAYLTRIGIVADAPDVFYHTLAILHAPDYRKENSGALRQDWPRIPLPDTKEALLASAALGKQIVALLDTETPFDVAAGLSRHPESGDVKSPLLGTRTCDVYLNDVAYWSNIPIRVWEYTIGGYQVIKKWLSYREEKLLGRSLSKEEVRYVQEMARRIAAIIMLEPALDANYQSVKAHTFDWKPFA